METIINETRNKFKKINSNLLMSQIFVPKQQVNRLKQFVHDMNSQHHLSIDLRSESFLAKRYQPPTMFEKSDFTGPFQEIIDTYGVP